MKSLFRNGTFSRTRFLEYYTEVSVIIFDETLPIVPCTRIIPLAVLRLKRFFSRVVTYQEADQGRLRVG